MNRTKVAANVSTLEVSPEILVMFSYETPVAALINGALVVTSTYHSQTTSRHISQWIGRDTNASHVDQSFLNAISYTL